MQWIFKTTLFLYFVLVQSYLGESSLYTKKLSSVYTVVFNGEESPSQPHSQEATDTDEFHSANKIIGVQVESGLGSEVKTTRASPVAIAKEKLNKTINGDDRDRNYMDTLFAGAGAGADKKVTIGEKNELRATNYAKSTVRGSRTNNRKQENERLVKQGRVGNKWEDLENRMNDVDYQIKKSPKKLVCYYNAPSFQDKPFAVFPEQIGPSLCTHIIIGFAHITSNLTLAPGDLKDLEFYNRTLNLKSSNNDLKVMLTVGGAGNNSCFPEMIATNETRAKFIKNVIAMMDIFPFDGFDFDWEFPAWDGPIQQKSQLLLFFQELRSYTDKIGRPIILTAAVPSPKILVDVSYDVSELASVLDFINLMTYDFHFYTWYTPFTGANAPLFSSKDDIGMLSTLNTAWSAKYWYENGMPANKIVVGAPTYGHTYKLVDRKEHSYMSLAMNIGSVGSAGYINYPEICEFIARNGTQVVFDNVTQVPYAFNDRDWISYDNEESARRKAEWVNEYDFGGIMIYCINGDDAWKMCNTSQTTFPIINAIKTVLFPGGAV